MFQINLSLHCVYTQTVMVKLPFRLSPLKRREPPNQATYPITLLLQR
jgi:hypothetical protein